jgi:hypothetical protein
MKIQPIAIWHNGKEVEATDLFVTIINDNLIDTSVLYWQLVNITENVIPSDDEEAEPQTTTTTTQLAQGNEVITGEDYANWDGNNLYPYEYVASNINVTLITE